MDLPNYLLEWQRKINAVRKSRLRKGDRCSICFILNKHVEDILFTRCNDGRLTAIEADDLLMLFNEGLIY